MQWAALIDSILIHIKKTAVPNTRNGKNSADVRGNGQNHKPFERVTLKKSSHQQRNIGNAGVADRIEHQVRQLEHGAGETVKVSNTDFQQRCCQNKPDGQLILACKPYGKNVVPVQKIEQIKLHKKSEYVRTDLLKVKCHRKKVFSS